MTFAGWLTIVLFVVILTALAMPLGGYMAKVYTGKRVFLSPVFGVPERFLYRVLRVDPERGQDWKGYAKSQHARTMYAIKNQQSVEYPRARLVAYSFEVYVLRNGVWQYVS